MECTAFLPRLTCWHSGHNLQCKDFVLRLRWERWHIVRFVVLPRATCAKLLIRSQWCCQDVQDDGLSCCNRQNATFGMPTGFGEFFLPAGAGAADTASSVMASSIAMPTSPAVTQTATTTVTQVATATATPSGAGSSHLPTTVGAAVGVPLGVLALAIVGYLLWRARRKSQPPQSRSRSGVGTEADEDGNGKGPMIHVQLAAQGGHQKQDRSHGAVSGQAPVWHELSEQPGARELGGRPHVLELDTGLLPR